MVRIGLFITFLTALAGCSPAGMVPTDTGGSSDAVSSDAAAPNDTPSQGDTGSQVCTYPFPATFENFGNAEGRPFRPFALPNCDGSGDFNFAGDGFCESRLTLIVFSAGWCGPCRAEAPMIESLITQRYPRSDIRVVVIYGQNTDYSPPTFSECNAWRTSYRLTNTMVIDPTGMTQVYFPNMAYPANLIVDRNGIIQYRVYGASSGLTTLRNEIDRLLAL